LLPLWCLGYARGVVVVLLLALPASPHCCQVVKFSAL
jgi:hypothetical protein